MKLKSLLALLLVSVISTMYSCTADPDEAPLESVTPTPLPATPTPTSTPTVTQTTVPTPTTPTTTPSASATPDLYSYTYSSSEIQLIDLINSYRVSIGLNSLLRSNYISSLAEAHNDYMITTNTLSHDNFNVRSQNIMNTLGAVAVGENVAYNSSNAQAAFDSWLASSGHKANIEGSYTHFGISVRINSVTGRIYYTNIFAKI